MHATSVGNMVRNCAYTDGGESLSGARRRRKGEHSQLETGQKDFGRSVIEDSWTVAHHFCLRYGAKVVPTQTTGITQQCTLLTERAALPVVTLFLFWQRCTFLLLQWGVAASAGCRTDIGTCVLRTRVGTFACFPHVLCTEGLAYLKTAAIN